MLKDENRLRRAADFDALYKRSTTAGNRKFLIRFRGGAKKFGIVVSKKHGNAVKRNLIKRRIRAILEELMPNIKDFTVIIIPKVGVLDLTYKELRKNLIHVLKQGKLLK